MPRLKILRITLAITTAIYTGQEDLLFLESIVPSSSQDDGRNAATLPINIQCSPDHTIQDLCDHQQAALGVELHTVMPGQDAVSVIQLSMHLVIYPQSPKKVDGYSTSHDTYPLRDNMDVTIEVFPSTTGKVTARSQFRSSGFQPSFDVDVFTDHFIHSIELLGHSPSRNILQTACRERQATALEIWACTHITFYSIHSF
ncbi:hypothetical protein E1B28_006803 [Marasmius oreades]|uniref:Uncharacterized protein n=1 Tax=Marasmius oreades TaxID=181124 RepID=A0A9P7UWW5_9AGAR|nr:uncharacterized protein E1B28_006803 [Marasmius oreades]KAG7096129.1 hypothetical protein E1B28_006803 [Marasmius oreades]